MTVLVLRSSSLQELVLSGIGAKGDFWARFARSIKGNPLQQLHALDLSCNTFVDLVFFGAVVVSGAVVVPAELTLLRFRIDEKGALALASALSQLPQVQEEGLTCQRVERSRPPLSSEQGVSSLNLADTTLTAKAATAVAKALLDNHRAASTLHSLNISNNSGIGQDAIAQVLCLLKGPNKLQELVLSNTGLVIEPTLTALGTCVCQQLTKLNVAQNKFTSKSVLGRQTERSSCLQFRHPVASPLTGKQRTTRAIQPRPPSCRRPAHSLSWTCLSRKSRQLYVPHLISPMLSPPAFSTVVPSNSSSISLGI